MNKTVRILGWVVGGLLAAAAIVLAVLSSVFSIAVMDYVAIALLVAAVIIEICVSIVEINPKSEDDDSSSGDSNDEINL